MNPPAYNDSFSINDTGVLEVKTSIDREICPNLVVGIQVEIVLAFYSQFQKIICKSQLLLIVFLIVIGIKAPSCHLIIKIKEKKIINR